MIQDEKYEFALAAALVILDQFDAAPAMTGPERLAVATYSILHAMRRYEADRARTTGFISLN